MNDHTAYRIINLTSGDNIIGQVINKEDKSVTVYRPYQMKIITLMDQAGPLNMFRQEALVMRNWLDLSKDEKVTISKEQIISMTEPTNKVCEVYDDEKEKEDNPSYMEELIEKYKDKLDLEDEELSDGLPSEEDFVKNMTLEIDPEDIRDIISDIIKNSSSKNQESEEEEEEQPDESEIENPESFDTDNEMYGW